MMRRQLLAIALLSIGSVAALHAQEHPVVQTGFAPDKVYNFFGIDSVNTFNGNLTIQLPMGFKYPLNGGLSYGLTLSYNSKVWTYSTQAFVCGGGPICPPFVTRAQPSVRSNAGLGWVLSMGRFVPPEDPLSTHPNGGYQTPDGATHAFYKELHPGELDSPYEGKGYTRDNTYMRTNCSSTGCVVNQPDGTIHTFAPDGALLSIRDQFDNGVNIRTIVDEQELGRLQQCQGTAGRTQAHSLSSAWEVTDDEDRKHYVCFTDSPHYENIYGNQLVYRVVVQAPGNKQAEYDFWYSIPVNPLAPDGFGVLRGCRSTVPNDDLYPNVPLLDRLILPDGSAYSANYSAGGSCSQGSLTSLTLPTGGKIDYTYRYWELPISRCDVPAGDWREYSSGVATRQIIDGATNPIWVYDTVHGAPPAGNHACGWFGGDRSAPITRPNPRETDTTLLRSPDGTVRKYWYSVWPYTDASPNGFVYKEFSLPLTRLPLAGANPRGNTFLSTETYGPNGTKLRSEYRRFEYAPIRCEDMNIGTPPSTFETNPSCIDSNRRVVEEQTIYDADGGRASSTKYSDFDGFGHYRQTETTGTFGSDTTRTSIMNYNPGTDAAGKRNGQFAFGDGDAWLLNTFDSQTVKEGQQATKTEFHFDSEGMLQRQRMLRNFGNANGSFTRDKNDLLTVFTRDESSGNLTATSYYGGDCLDAPNCSQDLGLGDLAGLSLPGSPAYEIRHTYSHGVRETSTYYDGGSPVLKFLDRSIDSSGAVTCEKDTAGLATCFTYDSMGRVKSVTPPGGAVTAYVYTNAAGSSPAEVAVTKSDTSTIFQFDPVGRLWREKRLMPDGSTSIQETRYDALGNKDSVSEFEKLLVEESIFVPADKTEYDYDPFGRPASVRAPDGAVTEFTYTGHGERETKRTSRFWTGNAVGTATVTEEYDVFRRLVKVTEQSGKPSSTNPDGREVGTTYGYDVANRLTSVLMDNVQPRTFVYDGRGLLKEETHPETSGTTYDLYDARGHARRQTTAGRTLAFDYDPAERLVGVSERQGTTETPLKTFKFGDANASNNLKKGKLESATRHNETDVAGQVDVTESYEYAPPSGLMSKRTTTIERVDTVNGQTVRTPIKTLEYKTDYDALLLPKTITLPTCDGCEVENGIARATNSRTAGYLTAVDGFGSLTYHPSGMVETVMHQTRNKPVDTYSQRNNMARPSKITFAGCGSLMPYFLPGQVLVKATSENNSCGLQVTWPSALVCGASSNVKYQVLRDNVPIGGCLIEPKFIDKTAVKGATYTYTIVAEGPTADGGDGTCNPGGLTVRRAASAFEYKSCPTETLLTVKDAVINVGATTEFEATLASENGPVQDEYLIFSVLGQEIGRARTNANGKAFVSAILDVQPKLYDEADSLTVTYAGGIMPAKTVSKKIYAVCTTRSYGIKPLALNVMAQAASYPIFVQTSRYCSWDPTLGLFPFYKFTPDTEQKGTGTFNVDVEKLEGTGARYSEALIAGQKLKIEQSSECNYEFDPQFNYFQADTFSGTATASIRVSAPPDCKWKVRSDVNWIQVNSTIEHTGSETIQFQYFDNEGINKRLGHLLIDAGEGATAFINQEALPESVCPEIHRDIEGGSVRNGQNVAIRVDASGTFLHYEWWINDRLEYECRGCSSVTLAPGMDGYPAPGETNSYQVRVFNTCGEVTSKRVTWSNSSQTCKVPSIADSTFHTNAWPADIVVGSSGSRTKLRVVGDGWPDPNPVKYQWYSGFSGNTDNPLTGPDGYGTKDEVEVGPGYYWVEVTNACGSNQSRTARVFVFVPPPRIRPVHHSLDGDNYSDVVWQNPATNQAEIWKMNGATYDDKTYALPNAPTATSKLQSVGDLNADGHPDLIWRDPESGQNQAWLMRYTNVMRVAPLEARTDKRWTIGAVADFDGDDHDDVVWHNAATGANEIWFHRDTNHEGTWALPTTSAGIHGAGDFNGDEVPDLFLHDRNTGQNMIWGMREGKPIGTFSRFVPGTDTASQTPDITTHALPPMADHDWIPAFIADMDGNGRPDILWRNVKTGENKVWIMNLYMFQEEKPATPRDPAWDIAGGGSSNSGDTSGGGGGGGGTATALQLSADPAPLGTATAVTATLQAGGAPLAQRTLVFLLNDNEATRLRTDANGQATAAITVGGMAAGTYPNAIKVRFDGDSAYSASTASTDLVIQAQPVTVTWLNPAPIVYGTPLSGAQLNATASAPGTFVYSPVEGTVLGAGYQTLALTFTPSDTSLAPVTKNAVLLVTKAPTSVTWAKPEEIAYGVPLSDEQLNATASVPGSFEYDPPAGTNLPVGSAQQLKVVFEPESPNYDKSSGSTTIDVTKGSQLIQWSNPAPILFGAALGNAELNARVIPSGSAPAGALTYDPPAGTILAEGVHELKVTVAETASYTGASATVDLIVRPSSVIVAWAPPAPITYGTPLSVAQLNATASMGGTFVYDPAPGTILNSGTHTLTARFTPADPRYQPVSVSVTLEVKKVKSEIVWPHPVPIVYGMPLSPTELSAVATVPGQIVFVPALGTILDAGRHTLSATFTPNDPVNHESASATVLLDVSRAPQVITWSAPAPIVYGTALSSTQLNATVKVVGPSPAGAITYSPAAGTILNAGAAQTLTVNVAATPNYEPATKSVTLDVLKADPKITWAKPAGIVYGTALGTGQLNATADVNGTFVYTPPSGTILDAGPAQTLAVHFTPSDTRNYNDADQSVTIDVARARQLITWTQPASIVYGTALSTAQLNARVDVVGPSPAGAVTYTPSAGTVLDAGSGQTLSVAVAETHNYEPASATVTLDVHRAPLSLTVDAKSKLYGGALPVLTGVLTGVVNNDPITATYATTATQASPAGTYPITGTLVDPNHRLVNYDVTITSSTLTVNPAPLTIAANPATKQYSDPLPVLTATYTGFVLGETPSVLTGTLSIQTTAQMLSAPGAYPITIGGLTSPNYAITYVGSTFTVTPEDARVSVISPRLVSAAASGPTTVLLAATIQDISATADAAGDVDAGDIRNATVTFVDRATNATLCTAPIGLSKPSDLRTGVITCTFTRDFGTTLPASLVVGTRVAAYYTRDAAADDVTMSIVASTADFITGAGSFGVATAAGPNAPDLNSEGKFELNMQYQKADDLRGRFHLTFNRTETGAVKKYELEIVTPMSMTVQRATGGGTATIIGTASIVDVSANTTLVTAAPVVVVATDAGEPGTNDGVSITVYNPAGGVWFASGWNGLQAVEQKLKNGNLTVVQREK